MSLSKVAKVDEITKQTKKPKKRHYQLDVDDEYIQDKHIEQANKHSKRGEKLTEKAFTDYLKAMELEKIYLLGI